jgi:hypothetical protein
MKIKTIKRIKWNKVFSFLPRHATISSVDHHKHTSWTKYQWKTNTNQIDDFHIAVCICIYVFTWMKSYVDCNVDVGKRVQQFVLICNLHWISIGFEVSNWIAVFNFTNNANVFQINFPTRQYQVEHLLRIYKNSAIEITKKTNQHIHIQTRQKLVHLDKHNCCFLACWTAQWTHQNFYNI